MIDVNGTEINFFVTHLAHDSADARHRQFNEIAKVVKQYDNFIVTGDFNTTDFTAYEVIEGADMVNHANYKVPTFPSTGASIDNIVYSVDNWSFEKPKNLLQSYSDHYLLYAKGFFRKVETANHSS